MNDQEWIPIRYRDFHDFPRAFVIARENEWLLFDCPFSDDLDEYPDEFQVYRLARTLIERIDDVPWTDLAVGSERLGIVPTKAVVFDDTGRKSVRSDVLDFIR
jgi:hypothetical protein